MRTFALVAVCVAGIVLTIVALACFLVPLGTRSGDAQDGAISALAGVACAVLAYGMWVASSIIDVSP